MTRVCPKCQYVRKDTDAVPDWQCPACQVAYHKVGSAPERRAAAHGSAPRRWPVWLLATVLLGTAAWLAKPSPRAQRSAAAAVEEQPAVVLYATSWCGYCAATRELFEQNGIRYRELDIEKSTEGYEGHKKLGGRGVPVIVVGDEVVHGYNEDALRASLQPWLRNK